MSSNGERRPKLDPALSRAVDLRCPRPKERRWKRRRSQTPGLDAGDRTAPSSSPNADPGLTGRAGTLVVTHCATGKRSILAADLLQKLGYRNVVSIRGGFVSWAREGLPID